MEDIKTTLRYILKRDGRVVDPFDPKKIVEAIFKAAKAVGGTDQDKSFDVARSVVDILSIVYKDGRIPTVENVQDLVEKILIEKGHARVCLSKGVYPLQRTAQKDS